MNFNKRVLVVGSGIAAYGTCLALFEFEDIKIDVLDIGLRKRYKNQPNIHAANGKDIESSFFPYGFNDNRWKIKLISKRICSSHAHGGFSKVWSGSFLRPNELDLANWPKESIPSWDDYKKVIGSLKVNQIYDELDNVFPIEQSKKLIKKKGSFLGRSRIAYSEKLSSENILKSVPFDTSISFDKWAKDGLISYKKDLFVTHCQTDKSNKIVVYVDSLKNPIKLKYDYVYLAAGCVNTTAIVDKSINGNGSRKYFIKSAPFLVQAYLKIGKQNKPKRIFNGVDDYGLCEYFLEQKNKLTLNYWSHTQIGPINRIILEKLQSFIPKNFNFIINLIKKNIKFSITNFHSDHCSEIVLTSIVNNDKNKYKQKILIEEPYYECSNSMYLATKLGVLSKFRRLKLIPIPFSKLIGNILKANKLGSWHFGGTLPMSKSKKYGNCTVDGEVYGMENLFVVDSSNFPSIPGTTVALLSMANAYRIAKKSLKNK